MKASTTPAMVACTPESEKRKPETQAQKTEDERASHAQPVCDNQEAD